MSKAVMCIDFYTVEKLIFFSHLSIIEAAKHFGFKSKTPIVNSIKQTNLLLNHYFVRYLSLNKVACRNASTNFRLS